jgi:hypothetical protein
MFDRLEVGEEQFDGFVLDEVVEEIADVIRWLAVARVHCGNAFIHLALRQQMFYAWNSVEDISMRPIGENRFVIQCRSLGIGGRLWIVVHGCFLPL